MKVLSWFVGLALFTYEAVSNPVKSLKYMLAAIGTALYFAIRLGVAVIVTGFVLAISTLLSPIILAGGIIAVIDALFPQEYDTRAELKEFCMAPYNFICFVIGTPAQVRDAFCWLSNTPKETMATYCSKIGNRADVITHALTTRLKEVFTVTADTISEHVSAGTKNITSYVSKAFSAISGLFPNFFNSQNEPTANADIPLPDFFSLSTALVKSTATSAQVGDLLSKPLPAPLPTVEPLRSTFSPAPPNPLSFFYNTFR